MVEGNELVRRRLVGGENSADDVGARGCTSHVRQLIVAERVNHFVEVGGCGHCEASEEQGSTDEQLLLKPVVVLPYCLSQGYVPAALAYHHKRELNVIVAALFWQLPHLQSRHTHCWNCRLWSFLPLAMSALLKAAPCMNLAPKAEAAGRTATSDTYKHLLTHTGSGDVAIRSVTNFCRSSDIQD